jgi:hypothetical protein
VRTRTAPLSSVPEAALRDTELSPMQRIAVD